MTKCLLCIVTQQLLRVFDHDVGVELLQLLVQLLHLLVGLLQHVVHVGQALLVRGHLEAWRERGVNVE